MRFKYVRRLMVIFSIALGIGLTIAFPQIGEAVIDAAIVLKDIAAETVSYATGADKDYEKLFTYKKVPSGYEITGYNMDYYESIPSWKRDGHLEFPSHYAGEPVVKISSNDAYRNIVSLTIPDTVKSIQGNIFRNRLDRVKAKLYVNMIEGDKIDGDNALIRGHKFNENWIIIQKNN